MSQHDRSACDMYGRIEGSLCAIMIGAITWPLRTELAVSKAGGGGGEGYSSPMLLARPGRVVALCFLCTFTFRLMSHW